MKIFDKKFKVRVSYFARGRYTVDYTHYRLIPIWRSLFFWFEQTLTGGTQCWSEKLFNVKEAEELATTLKSIEDIRKWYKADEKKEAEFYKRKEAYYKKNVPYRTKQI